ncbi:DUF4252 domain-containing protein [Candidatus Sumerlaeota bacterium]|nr:DUF4252 domain-containing protein [Candidatus Sumerlaeota bacterium]
MNGLNVWLNSAVINLGWTLLHFVWQGLLVAAGLQCALYLLRNSSAQKRYLAALAALLLMAALPLITCCVCWNHADSSDWRFAFAPEAIVELTPSMDNGHAALSAPQALSVQTMTAESGHGISLHNFTHNLRGMLLPLMPMIVYAWFLGVMLLSLYRIGALASISRLKRRQVRPIGEPLYSIFIRLCDAMGVQRTVRLLESALVDSPSVIGIFKPVILLPASALCGLPQAQLEAILVHELAHIRRYDFLWNLLQTLIETLLFYHPAVWWVSKVIRKEREHCCDDCVIRQRYSVREYALALTRLEEMRMEAGFSLAIAATNGPLLQRVRRLAGVPNPHRFNPTGLISSVIVIILSLAMIGTAMQSKKIASAKQNDAPAASVVDAGSAMMNETQDNAVPAASSAEQDDPFARVTRDMPLISELNLNEALLNAVGNAVAQNHDVQLAEIFQNHGVHSVRVKVLQTDGDQGRVQPEIGRAIQQLRRAGWTPLFRASDSNVELMIRSDGQHVTGVLGVIYEQGQLVHFQLDGDIDVQKFGRKLGKLLYMISNDDLDWQEIKSIAQKNLGLD